MSISISRVTFSGTGTDDFDEEGNNDGHPSSSSGSFSSILTKGPFEAGMDVAALFMYGLVTFDWDILGRNEESSVLTYVMLKKKIYIYIIFIY